MADKIIEVYDIHAIYDESKKCYVTGASVGKGESIQVLEWAPISPRSNGRLVYAKVVSDSSSSSDSGK